MLLNKKSFMFCMLLTGILFSQGNHYISGTVKDKNNEPLIGANINLKGTFLGSTTDFNGNYRIDNIDPGKYILMVSYIGYKSKEFELYISEFETKENEESDNSFSSKLGIDDEEEEFEDVILKAPFHSNINFILEIDALETEQVVVSASKKKEKLIDAPITIAAVSNQQIRKTAGGDLGAILKTVRGVETYQVGMGRTAINVRGFMSAFNGRFVSLVDGANYMEPTFYIAYGNTLPFINEDIERLEVVFGPSSALYGPNAHNGLLNVITKHPRESQGIDIAFGGGSSSYSSQRVRYAKARGPIALKLSLENTRVLDWEYPRTFGQDYSMDGEITNLESHESVVFWDFWNSDLPEAWNDKNNDGQWDHVEEITVMDSEYERKMLNTKLNLQLWYNISALTEVAFGHEHYFQSGYQPFDSGLNFIDYSIGSLWSKISRKNFFGRLHWLRSTGGQYWNSDVAYLNMMRRDLSLQESVLRTKIPNFVKTDVYRGDFQNSFSFRGFDFILGADFAFYEPNSNRQFLDDRGIVGEEESPILEGTVKGEKIKISEFGSYFQTTVELPLQTKFVTALRYDKHSYYEGKVSPRYALQWNGLKSGNIRFTYNRAFQTPSIFNLHMLRYFNPLDGGNILPFIFDQASFIDIPINVNDPLVQQQINSGQLSYSDLSFYPMQTQFRGNKNGFIIDEKTVIPPLGIETVDSYELGIKKMFFGTMFLDVSFFYSGYKNFISPLRIINDFYPSEAPYIPQEVTSIGDQYINDFNARKRTVIYSYTSTSDATVFGSDVMIKYNFADGYIFSMGFSFYDNLKFDEISDENNDLLQGINVDSVKNDTLRYFLENSLQSYSFQPGKLYFNAPKNKGFFSVSKDGIFIEPLWIQLTGSYTQAFDFVSGYHVATANRNLASLSPNRIYENKGPIGGGWIFDLHAEYTLNDKIRLKFQLNNILDQDGPRVVGTPPMRRNMIFETLFNFK